MVTDSGGKCWDFATITPVTRATEIFIHRMPLQPVSNWKPPFLQYRDYRMQPRLAWNECRAPAGGCVHRAGTEDRARSARSEAERLETRSEGQHQSLPMTVHITPMSESLRWALLNPIQRTP